MNIYTGLLNLILGTFFLLRGVGIYIPPFKKDKIDKRKDMFFTVIGALLLLWGITNLIPIV